MNNKMLKLFIIVMLLFFISSCNPVSSPTYGAYKSSCYLDDVNDGFIPEYTRLADERGFTVKNLYGTFYIPKSMADNTVDVESKKQSTREDRLENCIDRYYWHYGVYFYNGETSNSDIPKELVTYNALGVIPSEYYYSFLRLSSTYVHDFYKSDTDVFIKFYNCYDVLDLDSITPFKEREYLVGFYNNEVRRTGFYSLNKEKEKVKELLQNEKYKYSCIGYIDSYYIEYEGKKIKICECKVESIPSRVTIDNQEIHIGKDEISDFVNGGIVSEKFNVMDIIITDEYFGLSNGIFEKYYIETIISDNLENKESN